MDGQIPQRAVGVTGGPIERSPGGHALKALGRLKVPGFAEQVEMILSETRMGWVRSAARKYLRETHD